LSLSRDPRVKPLHVASDELGALRAAGLHPHAIGNPFGMLYFAMTV
jgi:hypothetical protein